MADNPLNRLWIGLDAHSKNSTYVVQDFEGRELGWREIPSRTDAFEEMARSYPTATVIIEASSVHYWICDVLKAAGMNVVAIHPRGMGRDGPKRKNDLRDARKLITKYRAGDLRPAWIPPPPIRDLRQLARHCAFLTHQRTRVMNRIHGILRRRGKHILDLAPDSEGEDLFSRKNREELLATGDDEIPILLDLRGYLTKVRKRAERRVEKVVEASPHAMLLRTIPGFGPLTALAIYAEIGDPGRFPNAKSVIAYFGLDPSESSSGGTRHFGHITKAGSPIARWLLDQAAWRHIYLCRQGDITLRHARIRIRSGYKKAITATAARLAAVAWSLLKENRAFTMTTPNGRAQRTP